ncbi:NUDIX hydrolase [Rhizobium paknamense]|uniref:ADP-ribose pyrophosphatase YjhB (NUDIX family) n=1 Tax=Rhizobium paknamense TaxID=1206817 RepID=A0ABU0IIM5_9HYPH|nr:NUDIX hydrolase [Rhizobium paknamense]MDQ0457059.1 ADP-ribose pyrophosphatase YjhB (NUDIX family) [Rhizobium paknamense]
MMHERHMIRLDRKPLLFSMRVAGLIFQNDHLLVQRGAAHDYWALPGGRAEIGETSEETIIREIREELDCEARIDRLLFTVENFFPYEGYQAHELSFYYLLEPLSPLPFHDSEIVHRVQDGPTEVLFRWVPAVADSFERFDIHPRLLSAFVENPPHASRHIINRESAGT